MKVILLYNEAVLLKRGRQEDLKCEQESAIVARIAKRTLEEAGITVDLLEANSALERELTNRRGCFDLVLNIAEGFAGANANEFYVPALLEMLDVPFTGPPLRTYVYAYDKWKLNSLLSLSGIPIPPRRLYRENSAIRSDGLNFPVIVKPVREDASIGITFDSVVETDESLIKQVKWIWQTYRQPAVVEQFIYGREISVGCIGDRQDLRVFPPLEFTFPPMAAPLRRFRSYEHKWGGKREKMVMATLPAEVIAQLEAYVHIAFTESECRDYARIDFRYSNDGRMYLIDVNCNPGIGPNSDGLSNTLTQMASFDGIDYADFLLLILQTATRRYEKMYSV